jgi:hypothetical protein
MGWIHILRPLMRPLLAAIAITVFVAAQYTNDDGWQHLQWGMTVAEVERSVSGIQKILPETGIPAAHQGKGFHFFIYPGMRLYLPGYDVDGEPTTVIFMFDGSDKLVEVRVHADAYRTRRYADRILQALKAKYGEPTEYKREGIPGRDDLKAKWARKNTIIEYLAMEWNYDGEVSLSITYERGPLSAIGRI